MTPDGSEADRGAADVREWIGRTETRHDRVTPRPVAALSATLDRNDPDPASGDPLPPLWHWLYFLPRDCSSALGPEGHARTGGLLPPSPLPRRMWAGSRIQFHRALHVGDDLRRVSTIHDVRETEGRSGALMFVVVRHQISRGGEPALTEEHDIVYREGPKPDARAPEPERPPTGAVWTRRIDPDDVLLFRYSALTFNSHRIHYDWRYATEVEGYPGLVVHGPLVATLLMDLVRREAPRTHVRQFRFRAVAPLFDTAPFQVCGRPDPAGGRITLWAIDDKGQLAVWAEAVTAG